MDEQRLARREREREGQDNKKEAASGNGERLSRGRVESESVGPTRRLVGDGRRLFYKGQM